MNRALSNREQELLDMIRPTNFEDILENFHEIVEIVRKDIEIDRYNKRRLIRDLKNGKCIIDNDNPEIEEYKKTIIDDNIQDNVHKAEMVLA